jgi:hypothetical protein
VRVGGGGEIPAAVLGGEHAEQHRVDPRIREQHLIGIAADRGVEGDERVRMADGLSQVDGEIL